MRIVVTSDTHRPVDLKLIPDGDVFIHAGDLMNSGTPDEWNQAIDWLAELPHKTKIIVPGNHDFHFQVYPGPAIMQMRQIGFIVLGLPGNEYQSTVLPNGMSVLGLPYVKNLPRWCFNTTEQDMFQLLNNMKPHDIVVSHSPIRSYLDTDIKGDFTGFDAYAHYLYKTNPKYWFHGHIHERYGKTEIQNTEVYNVCMCDRSHRHVNKPIVIDV